MKKETIKIFETTTNKKPLKITSTNKKKCVCFMM